MCILVAVLFELGQICPFSPFVPHSVYYSFLLHSFLITSRA